MERWPGWVIEEYRAYDSIQPFGDVRSNWHAAMIAHIMATAYSNPKRKRPQLQDFMWRTAKQKQMDNIEAADKFFEARRKANGNQ